MRNYILVEGDSIMAQKMMALVKGTDVDRVIVLNEEDIESLKADIELQFGGELIDATDWEDDDKEDSVSHVSPGFSYIDGKFVKPEPTPNTITEEDLAKSAAILAADIARGDRPDLTSIPDGEPGPNEGGN